MPPRGGAHTPAVTILVVDDDPDQLTIRSLLLTSAGYHTLLAGTVASALDLASVHRPSLAVIDLRLPTSREGFELLAGLNSLLPALKILVLTGFLVPDLREHLRQAGVKQVLEKGQPAQLLIAALKQMA